MVVPLAGALGGLNSTPHEPLVSPVPLAAPFPEMAMPEEPCLLRGAALPGDGVPQGGSCRASKPSQPTLESMEDPSISLQNTGRRNTLSAVKCSDNRAKGSAPVPQGVSKEGNGPKQSSFATGARPGDFPEPPSL